MLMGTQLINPKYFTQEIIWPSSARLLFSSPYCPQIQPVLSIHLKGGYKSRLKKTKKSKTLLSCFPRQDSAVLYCHSCLSPAPCSPPAQLHHHMVWAMGWVQLFPQHSKVPWWWSHIDRAKHTPTGSSALSTLQAGNALRTPPELDSIWFALADTFRNVFVQKQEPTKGP